MSAPIVIIHPVSAPQAVSTLTPLYVFQQFQQTIQAYLLAVQNVGSVAVTVFFETSEDGVSVDVALYYTYTIQPGQQCSLQVGPNDMRKMYLVSAETAAPSYPTGSVTWSVTGLGR